MGPININKLLHCPLSTKQCSATSREKIFGNAENWTPGPLGVKRERNPLCYTPPQERNLPSDKGGDVTQNLKNSILRKQFTLDRTQSLKPSSVKCSYTSHNFLKLHLQLLRQYSWQYNLGIFQFGHFTIRQFYNFDNFTVWQFNNLASPVIQ